MPQKPKNPLTAKHAPKSGKTAPKIIPEDEVRKLAERQWKISEIAAFFSCSHDTIERKFASIITEARESGRAKLRDLQWRRAMEGSDKIIVHMSKHYLDQHDKIENKVVADVSTITREKAGVISDDEMKARLAKLKSEF